MQEGASKEPDRRGDALRVLTDFSPNEIYPLLFELVKKGVNDTSPYVRLCALNGLLKVT
jgi:vesicle coat complex subunit